MAYHHHNPKERKAILQKMIEEKRKNWKAGREGPLKRSLPTVWPGEMPPKPKEDSFLLKMRRTKDKQMPKELPQQLPAKEKNGGLIPFHIKERMRRQKNLA